MSENWQGIAAEVAGVIADLGSTARLFRQPTGGPAAPHLSGTFDKDNVGTAFNYFPSSFNFKDGSYFKIQTGDLAVLIPASVAPRTGDNVAIRNENWTIVSFMILDPQETVIMYKAQLRKA